VWLAAPDRGLALTLNLLDLLVAAALIFETIGRRLNRLAVPIIAVVTVHALLVIAFGLSFRIADGLSAAPIFASGDGPLRLDVAGAPPRRHGEHRRLW